MHPLTHFPIDDSNCLVILCYARKNRSVERNASDPRAGGALQYDYTMGSAITYMAFVLTFPKWLTQIVVRVQCA